MDKRYLILVVCLAMGGCMPHIKAFDSHDSMFSNVKPTGFADPYANGGIGEASGGTKLMAPGDKGANTRASEVISFEDQVKASGGTIVPLYRGAQTPSALDSTSATQSNDSDNKH